MSLLVLDRVTKRYRRGEQGSRERIALRDVTLAVEPGELVAVWGRRRSGRTTLLEVAAGIESPSEGSVRFAGTEPARALGAHEGIGYCTTTFARMIGDSVLEHVAAPLLGGDTSLLRAQVRADEALRRVGAQELGERRPDELDHAETVRVALARALVAGPRLLLVDEPTGGVPPARGRDPLLVLLRSLARQDGIAVLTTADEAAALAGADRALSLDAGELRGELSRPSASVVPLRPGLGSTRPSA